jgi:hypothetical protein
MLTGKNTVFLCINFNDNMIEDYSYPQLKATIKLFNNTIKEQEYHS